MMLTFAIFGDDYRVASSTAAYGKLHLVVCLVRPPQVSACQKGMAIL